MTVLKNVCLLGSCIWLNQYLTLINLKQVGRKPVSSVRLNYTLSPKWRIFCKVGYGFGDIYWTKQSECVCIHCTNWYDNQITCAGIGMWSEEVLEFLLFSRCCTIEFLRAPVLFVANHHSHTYLLLLLV